MSWKIAPIGRGGDLLYSQAGTPSLDLRFAEKKALTDYVSGDNLVTFSRSTSGSSYATYVDSDGLIKPSPVNYSLYSESLTNGWWSTQLASVSATSDVAPPAGIASIYKVTETATTGEHYFRGSQIVMPIPVGTYITCSVYLNTSLDRSKIRIYSFGQNNLAFIWDLVNNTQVGTTSGGTSLNANSQSLGNNWYRFSWTDAAATPGNIRPTFQLVDNSNQFNYTGDATKGFYATGVQIETGTTPTTYIPTTSSASGAPRFDHDPTTGESLGLLVEESRTNLLTYSEQFNNSGGWASTNASANNSGTVVAPDGTFTTDALTENLTTNSLHSVNAINAVLLNGVYTFSVYVKAATRTIVALNFTYANGAFSTSDARAWFNLSNGTVGTVANALDATITPIGSNGWYRCTLISNSYSGANRKCLIASSTADGSVTHNGSETDALYLWGAQLEAGSFPTSYIPTTGATATRTADVVDITGTNFSSWYNQSEGTLYVKAKDAVAYPSSLRHYADLNTGGLNPSITIVQSNSGYTGTGTRLVAGVYNGPSQAALDTGAQAEGVFALAFGFKLDDFRAARSGVLTVQDVSGSMPTASQLNIGSSVSGRITNNHISRLTYWPQRLPNTTLQTITT